MLILGSATSLSEEHWFEVEDGLRFKIASADNHQFRSKNSLVRRHMQQLDERYKVGTKEFSLGGIEEIDSLDDLLVENCARYLLKDWEGVGEVVDGKERPVKYSVEKGIALLKQQPDLYLQIVGYASQIADGKAQQINKTVKKS